MYIGNILKRIWNKFKITKLLAQILFQYWILGLLLTCISSTNEIQYNLKNKISLCCIVPVCIWIINISILLIVFCTWCWCSNCSDALFDILFESSVVLFKSKKLVRLNWLIKLLQRMWVSIILIVFDLQPFIKLIVLFVLEIFVLLFSYILLCFEQPAQSMQLPLTSVFQWLLIGWLLVSPYLSESTLQWVFIGLLLLSQILLAVCQLLLAADKWLWSRSKPRSDNYRETNLTSLEINAQNDENQSQSGEIEFEERDSRDIHFEATIVEQFRNRRRYRNRRRGRNRHRHRNRNRVRGTN